MMFCCCCTSHFESTVHERMPLISVGEWEGILTYFPVVPMVLPAQMAKLNQGPGALIWLFKYTLYQTGH